MAAVIKIVKETFGLGETAATPGSPARAPQSSTTITAAAVA